MCLDVECCSMRQGGKELSIYVICAEGISIYIYVCVCVCVCKLEGQNKLYRTQSGIWVPAEHLVSDQRKCGENIRNQVKEKIFTRSVFSDFRKSTPVWAGSHVCHSKTSFMWKWEWSNGGMILTGENGSTGRETCPIPTISIKHSSRIGLGGYQNLCN